VYRKLGHELDFYVLGEFGGFTLFCEENLFGGIWIYSFLGFYPWVHVGVLRRGDNLCYCECFGGI
jgi:hypothetical protein